MKTKQHLIIYAILVGVILLLTMTRNCGIRTEKKYIPVVSKVTLWKAIPYDKWYPKPTPFAVHDTFKVPVEVDSAQVVKDFYKLNIYKRTLLNDSNGSLVLTDSVTRNLIVGYSLTGKINHKETVITNTVTVPEKKRNKVYAGLIFGSDLSEVTLIPKISLVPKNDRVIYAIMYDPFNKYYYIGLDFKIKLW